MQAARSLGLRAPGGRHRTAKHMPYAPPDRLTEQMPVACAQAKGLTVVKVLRLAPPHVAPQGAWRDLSVSLQTAELHASFAAVCMPRSCLDRPLVRLVGTEYILPIMVSSGSYRLSGKQVQFQKGVHMRQTGVQPRLPGPHAGHEAVGRVRGERGGGSAAMRAHGQHQPPGRPARGPHQACAGCMFPFTHHMRHGLVISQSCLMCRIADHSMLLHFEGPGSSGCCALLMTSRSSGDLVRHRHTCIGPMSTSRAACNQQCVHAGAAAGGGAGCRVTGAVHAGAPPAAHDSAWRGRTAAATRRRSGQRGCWQQHQSGAAARGGCRAKMLLHVWACKQVHES